MNKKALIIADVQNDFLPGGALAVAGGDTIIPLINSISGSFGKVIAVQDWHPAGHVSFASAHGAKPYDIIKAGGAAQALWPDHCLQGSRGAELAAALDLKPVSLILRTGSDPLVDSYSAFLENDRKTATGLEHYLKGLGIFDVYLCGLATDYCVLNSALDAAAAGFTTHVIRNAACGLNVPPGSVDEAFRLMKAKGVKVMEHGTL